MDAGDYKAQMWWLNQSEFQPITHGLLQDNEYFDVQIGEKQDPYQIKLLGIAKEESKSSGEESVNVQADLDLSEEDLKETFFAYINKERRTIAAGEQIYYNYRDKNNR